MKPRLILTALALTLSAQAGAANRTSTADLLKWAEETRATLEFANVEEIRCDTALASKVGKVVGILNGEYLTEARPATMIGLEYGCWVKVRYHDTQTDDSVPGNRVAHS